MIKKLVGHQSRSTPSRTKQENLAAHILAEYPNEQAEICFVGNSEHTTAQHCLTTKSKNCQTESPAM